MDAIKRVLCCLLVFTAALSATGCVDRFVGEETSYSLGEVLTPEMIESIFEAISTPVTEKYPVETMTDGNVLLYWLKGGSVWHASNCCGSIARASAENVVSGNYYEALAAGKDRGCKICASDIDLTANAKFDSDHEAVLSDVISAVKYPKDYDNNGDLIVYWLENGSVWHLSKACSSLTKSSAEDIRHGTETDARSYGKERVCKICSKEN